MKRDIFCTGCFVAKIFFIFCFLLTGTVSATEVELAGIMGEKALLVIDGGNPRAFSVKQQANSVKLIAVRVDSAIVEIDGQTRTLTIGAVGAASDKDAEEAIMKLKAKSDEAVKKLKIRADEAAMRTVIRLKADKLGHFFTNGSINGHEVKFMVDTGASFISMGNDTAQELGLDLRREGRPGWSQTANGKIAALYIMLDSVQIGHITLRNIEAAVGERDMPYLLLGMSFLKHTAMQYEGDTLLLKQRPKE